MFGLDYIGEIGMYWSGVLILKKILIKNIKVGWVKWVLILKL